MTEYFINRELFARKYKYRDLINLPTYKPFSRPESVCSSELLKVSQFFKIKCNLFNIIYTYFSVMLFFLFTSFKQPSTDLSGISNTFGTRNFIPAFMGCVALLSVAMILFAVGRWFLYRTFRKRRKAYNHKTKVNFTKEYSLEQILEFI